MNIFKLRTNMYLNIITKSVKKKKTCIYKFLFFFVFYWTLRQTRSSEYIKNEIEFKLLQEAKYNRYRILVMYNRCSNYIYERNQQNCAYIYIGMMNVCNFGIAINRSIGILACVSIVVFWSWYTLLLCTQRKQYDA